MATCVPSTTVQRHHHPSPVTKFLFGSSPPFFTSLAISCSHNLFITNYYVQARLSVDRRLRRSVQLSAGTWSGRCRATSPGQPSPPKLDPPPGGSPDSSPGIMSRFSKAQDAVRIFFAVLFWMSLFFWSSVWDGRDDGRPNKGSRFRR